MSLLSAEADGSAGAQATLTGQPDYLDIGPIQTGTGPSIGPLQTLSTAPIIGSESDGSANPQATLGVGGLLTAEADGAGDAAILGPTGGYLDIGPIQTGSGLDIGPIQTLAHATPLLQGEADGIGNAQSEIVGPPIDTGGEADGVGDAQSSLRVGATTRGEADGIGNAQCDLIGPPEETDGESDGAGNAQCFLGGGTVSITCLTTGVVSGSPATPSSTVLYDAPSAW
jgi:hypothetical protein